MLDVYITKDGSPTLIFKRDDQDEVYAEKMHHSEGAWTETLYIYFPALEKAFQLPSPRVMSLGLGLGYNELMACAYEMKTGAEFPVLIHSYEILPELREEFSEFIENGLCKKYFSCYRLVLDTIAAHFEIESESLRAFVCRKLQKKELLLLEGFPQSLPDDQTYNCLLYDAFSGKMTPELWTEEFLKKIFNDVCETDCVVSTYAATGALKRSLISLNFNKIVRPGFSGKRDSSFYLRGRLDEDKF